MAEFRILKAFSTGGKGTVAHLHKKGTVITLEDENRIADLIKRGCIVPANAKINSEIPVDSYYPPAVPTGSGNFFPNTPITELDFLNDVQKEALLGFGIERLSDLETCTDDDLKKLQGIGEVTVKKLRNAIHKP